MHSQSISMSDQFHWQLLPSPETDKFKESMIEVTSSGLWDRKDVVTHGDRGDVTGYCQDVGTHGDREGFQ